MLDYECLEIFIIIFTLKQITKLSMFQVLTVLKTLNFNQSLHLRLNDDVLFIVFTVCMIQIAASLISS